MLLAKLPRVKPTRFNSARTKKLSSAPVPTPAVPIKSQMEALKERLPGKHAVLTTPDGPMHFLFPGEFSDEAITDAIRNIRTGDSHNWKREYLGMDVAINPIRIGTLFTEHKYVVIHNRDEVTTFGSRYMVVFPKKINHDNMLEVMQHAAYESTFPSGVSPFYPDSAGFVNDRACYGRSETLNLSSDPGDTELYRVTFQPRP